MSAAQESRIRSLARWRGYAVRKSRSYVRNDFEYRLVDVFHNCIVMGERYDATLDQIEEYLKEEAA
jgi:hypothetical protein